MQWSDIVINNAHLYSKGNIRLKSMSGGRITAQNVTSHTPGSSIIPVDDKAKIELRGEAEYVHAKEGGGLLIAGAGEVWTEGDAHGLTMP